MTVPRHSAWRLIPRKSGKTTAAPAADDYIAGGSGRGTLPGCVKGCVSGRAGTARACSTRRPHAALIADANASSLPLDAGRGVRRADGLGLGRPALSQVDAQDGHRADGEELRLPVLQGRLPEVRAADVLQPAQRLLLVLDLIRVVGAPARYGLREPRCKEYEPHHDQERVGEQPPTDASDARPRRRVRRGVLADQLFLLGLGPRLVEFLGLRRALLQ